MGDVECITTTERHAELHGALMVAIQRGLAGVEGGEDDPPLVRAAEVVLPIIEHERAAERVRVVEGLVTTIKAQLRFSPMARTDEAVMRGDPDNGDYILRAKVLEALEAAREDTT